MLLAFPRNGSLALACLFAVLGAQQLPLPEALKKGTPVFTESPLPGMKSWGEEAGALATEMLAVRETKGAKGAKAANAKSGKDKEAAAPTVLRIATTAAAKKPTSMQVGGAAKGKLVKGEKVVLTVVARVSGIKTETGEGSFELVLQRNKPKPLVFHRAPLVVGKAWKRLSAAFEASDHAADGELLLFFRVGAGPYVLEIAEVQAYRFPNETEVDTLPVTRSTWAGREADAPWRRQAQARIDSLRKGTFELQVTRREKPVSGVVVKMEQRRHAFPFGTVVPRELTVGERASAPDAERFRELLEQCFTRGVDEGLQRRGWRDPERIEEVRRGLAWNKGRGLTNLKGSSLSWGRWDSLDPKVETRWSELAKSDRKGALEWVTRNVRDSLTDACGRLKGHVGEWNLLSDPNSELYYTDLFTPDEVGAWFKLAQRGDPGARRVLAFPGILTGGGLATNRLEAALRFGTLLSGVGAPIDAVALYGHFGSTLTAPEKILSMLDRFAGLGMPLLIKGIAIDVKDEATQGEYLRDLVTACFSHASVECIDLAGFWEGAHPVPSAALWRKNFMPKPAAMYFTNLVARDWWSRAEGRTDDTGTFRARVYCGDYVVSFTRGDLIQRMKISVGPGTTQLTEEVP